MQILHVRRRTCPGHPSGWPRGVVDGVKILYCPVCGGARLKATRFCKVKPSSILKMADICAWYLPKLETRSLGFLIGKAVQHYGMDYYAARRALHWLMKAGYFAQLSIDGVVATKDQGVTRELDALGDPPLLRHSLTCWRCGCEISLDDVLEGSDFSCPRCKKPYAMRSGAFVRARRARARLPF